MSLEHPLLLVALLLLPLAWWWHRRRHRPAVVAYPSLLFLEPEPQVPPTRRRVLDPELWLALLALLFAVLAAAGPRLETREAGRTIRVVVSGGAPGTARGRAAATERCLDAIRGALDPADRLDLLVEPARDPALRRPAPEALVAVARAGRAGRRYVLSDTPAPAGTADLAWIETGVSDASNVGLVAAALIPHAGGVQVFANVANSSARARRVRVLVDPGTGTEPVRQAVDVAADGHVSATFDLPRVGTRVHLGLEDADGGALADDLPSDDAATLERRALRVAFRPGLDPAVVRALEAVLAAAEAEGYTATEVEPDLVVAPSAEAVAPDGAWRLVLPTFEGQARRTAPPGPDLLHDDPATRDLSTAGVDLHFAAGADVLPDGAVLLLGRVAGGRTWPVVARRDRTLYFLPDPTAGTSPPLRAPLWPLFVDNVVRLAVGAPAGAAWGHRAHGLLDEGSTTLGRAVGPSRGGDLARVTDLAGVPADRPPTWRPFRPWLAALAVLCCLGLWGWGRWRPRRGRAHRAEGAAVPSSA